MARMISCRSARAMTALSAEAAGGGSLSEPTGVRRRMTERQPFSTEERT